METNYSFLFIIIAFLCFSFASENKSEILLKKENSTTKIISQNKNLVPSKKQKLNFKERLALKLIKKRIKKKQTKNIKSTKADGEGIVITALIALLLLLIGLISGIVYLALGETLLGALLLVGGVIFVPLIFALIVLLSIPPVIG